METVSPHSPASSVSVRRRNGPQPLSFAAWWILFGAFCSLTGWGLSAVHQLNPWGYAVALLLGGAVVCAFRRQLLPAFGPAGRLWLTKIRRRVRRPFPLAFVVLAGLATLGGLLYHPGNPDGLTQRIPRVLAWLAEGRWHWLEHSSTSFNSHAVGFEWLMAPMLALLKTDRWVFLYNVICYLLLPGLVFGTLHRLGVRPRVAWCWMWLAPAGLCFVMQAGSIANDMAGAILALAAVDFALRANTSGRYSDFCLSVLAAALLSNMKTSNLPLGLTWLVAIWPSRSWLRRRPLASALVLLAAVGASLVPLIVMNLTHGTSWCGEYRDHHQAPGLLVAAVGSSLNLAVENLLPPIFPMAKWWNNHIYLLLPTGLRNAMLSGFEPGAAHLAMKEIQYEIGTGIAFGLSWLVLISWLMGTFGYRSARGPGRHAPPGEGSAPDWHVALVRWCPYIGVLVFMSQMVVSGPARLITPYYCLLFPLLLAGPGQAVLVRRRWWLGAAGAVFLLAAFMVVLNPPRALWPAKTVLVPLSARHPHSQALVQGRMLYQAYADRWDAMAKLRDRLPAEAKNVGFITYITGSSMETSLWRPFGQRRVWHLPREVTRAEMDRKGIEYVVVGTDALAKDPAVDFEARFASWLRTNGGKVVAEAPVGVLATSESSPWYLVRFDPLRP